MSTLFFRRYALPMLFAWAAVLPIYFALLLAADSLCGSRQLLSWVLYESRHTLLYQQLQDSSAGLTVATPVALSASAIALRTYYRCNTWLWLSTLIGAALLIFLLLLAIAFDVRQALLFAAVIFFSTLCSVLLSRILNHA